MNILIAVYGSPERLPPTINAIECLAPYASNIDIFYRAHQQKDWDYPNNVNAIPDGKVISAREQEGLPIHKKITLFLSFSRQLLLIANQRKYDIILIYDAIALLAYRMIKSFIKYKMLLWYHNHDVISLNNIRKYSINWWAGQTDIKMISKLDIFSLPAQERRGYFQLDRFKGKYFFIPNFPRKSFPLEKQSNDIPQLKLLD